MMYINQARVLTLGAVVISGAILIWVIYDIAAGLINSESGSTVSQAVDKVAETTIPQYRVQDIINAHLFGVEQRQAPQQVSAPRTRLRLQLAGMVASNDPKQAIALIAADNGVPKPYRIGDSIKPSGAVVHLVEPNKVIIERAGRLESLYLERPTIEEPEKGTTKNQPAAAFVPKTTPTVRPRPPASNPSPAARQSTPAPEPSARPQ